MSARRTSSPRPLRASLPARKGLVGLALALAGGIGVGLGVGGCGGAAPSRVSVEGPALIAYGVEPLPLPSVTVRDAAGEPMPTPAALRWSVEPADLAALDGHGRLVPLRGGEGQLVASIGSLHDRAALSVVMPDRIELVGAASPQTLPVGRTLLLTALAVEAGRTVDRVPLRWSSSAPAVAAVRDGQLVGMRTGRATITVSGAGLSTSMEVVITPERRGHRETNGRLVAM
jgi:hypothetical protein